MGNIDQVKNSRQQKLDINQMQGHRRRRYRIKYKLVTRWKNPGNVLMLNNKS